MLGVVHQAYPRTPVTPMNLPLAADHPKAGSWLACPDAPAPIRTATKTGLVDP